jgi:3-hydroxyacyl-[acyl-carrier-protein] dehydratase
MPIEVPMRTLREEVMACADPHVRTAEVERSYEATFHFSSDFTGFQGHFPEFPILPAFVQLLMGECALHLCGRSDWTTGKVERSKFLKTIRPNQALVLRWQEQPQEGKLRCSFTLLADGEKAAVFTIMFVAGERCHA